MPLLLTGKDKYLFLLYVAALPPLMHREMDRLSLLAGKVLTPPVLRLLQASALLVNDGV